MPITSIGPGTVGKIATKVVLEAKRAAELEKIEAAINIDRKAIGGSIESLVDNTAGKVSGFGAKIAAGIESGVQKIKNGLNEVANSVKIKNDQRKSLKAEIETLETRQIKIKQQYDAKIAASESYTAEVAKLNSIKARKVELLKQLETLETAEKETEVTVVEKLNNFTQLDKEV